MNARATRPPSYFTRLLAELDEIQADYAKVLSASAIRNIDPARGSSAYPPGAGLKAARNSKRRAWRCCGLPEAGSLGSGCCSPSGAHRQQAPG
jgi:hypothetical protein